MSAENTFSQKTQLIYLHRFYKSTNILNIKNEKFILLSSLFEYVFFYHARLCAANECGENIGPGDQ
jgi:hypothetical protein